SALASAPRTRASAISHSAPAASPAVPVRWMPCPSHALSHSATRLSASLIAACCHAVEDASQPEGRNATMICDVHAHYIPQQFGDFMGERWGPRVGPAVEVKEGIAKHPVSDSIADIVGRLELMDAAGVEKQVLSPHRPPYLPDEKEGVQAIHLLNDGYAELAHRPPDRIAS